jgi:hypothetical protein
MNQNKQATEAITKILSANDTGETGSHQAGTHIPKVPAILSFFPDLGTSRKNPKVPILFTDEKGNSWNFRYIYYNNKSFGGTRNEYRLTGMTNYINSNRLRSGDRLILRRDDKNKYNIEYEKAVSEQANVIRLGNTWEVINI